MESVAQASGGGSITLSFQPGTNPDLAQVDVQNRLSRASPRLPAAVTQQGVRVPIFVALGFGRIFRCFAGNHTVHKRHRHFRDIHRHGQRHGKAHQRPQDEPEQRAPSLSMS